MSMGNLSGNEKPMIKSKIQNSKILTSFVTSRTPKMTQNGPKITKTPDISIIIKWLCCLRMRVGEFFWMENRLRCQNFDILTFGKGMLTFWRQIWTSPKCLSNDVRMPTNDRIELKICMDTYFHPRNAMLVPEF